MGGTVIETESEKIKIQMIVELGQEDGLSDEAIFNRLQNKVGVSPEKAKVYLSGRNNESSYTK